MNQRVNASKNSFPIRIEKFIEFPRARLEVLGFGLNEDKLFLIDPLSQVHDDGFVRSLDDHLNFLRTRYNIAFFGSPNMCSDLEDPVSFLKYGPEYEFDLDSKPTTRDNSIPQLEFHGALQSLRKFNGKRNPYSMRRSNHLSRYHPGSIDCTITLGLLKTYYLGYEHKSKVTPDGKKLVKPYTIIGGQQVHLFYKNTGRYDVNIAIRAYLETGALQKKGFRVLDPLFSTFDQDKKKVQTEEEIKYQVGSENDNGKENEPDTNNADSDGPNFPERSVIQDKKRILIGNRMTYEHLDRIETVWTPPTLPGITRLEQALADQGTPIRLYEIESNRKLYNLQIIAGLGAVYALQQRDIDPRTVPYKNPYFQEAIEIYERARKGEAPFSVRKISPKQILNT